MNGAALLTDFLVLMDKNSNDTSYKALALKWLDLILRDIQSRQDSFHWRFLEIIGATFDTAADDFDYDLDTIAPNRDTEKVIHVYDKTNDITYRYKPYEIFRRVVADETNKTGDPYIFSIAGGDLLLWPVPDSVVSTYIDYVRTIPTAADDSTDLLIPDKYKKVVMDGMMVYGFQFDPDLGNAATQHLIYKSGIDRMRKENSIIITESMQPTSHRWRHKRKGFDGTHHFPLETTNY